MRLLLRIRTRSEKGATILEVVITSALLLVVMGAILGELASFQKASVRVEALVANEQEVRLVTNDVVRDIRAANPLLAFSNTASDYSSRIEMQLGPTAGPQTRVRWVYDTNPASSDYRTLKREILNSAGTAVTASTVRLRNIRNVDRSAKMFTYTSQSGTDLVVAGVGLDVGNCAIHVEVVITADSNPGPEPFTIRSDAEIRNRLPGGVGCG